MQLDTVQAPVLSGHIDKEINAYLEAFDDLYRSFPWVELLTEMTMLDHGQILNYRVPTMSVSPARANVGMPLRSIARVVNSHIPSSFSTKH